MPTSANRPAGDGAAKRSPRERLLEAASELFYAEGVQSVGIDRVIERAGVAKASLYSTFGSKEELVCAYLGARHEQTLAALRVCGRRCRGSSRAARWPCSTLKPSCSARPASVAARSRRRPPRHLRAGESTRPPSPTATTSTALFTELAAAAGAPDPALLASQLQLIYDGGGLAANMDRNPGIATPARAAASALIAAALAR